MIKRSIRFFRGYRRVEVTSAYPERFLNMCLARDIELWDIDRSEEGVVRCTMSAGDCRVAEALERKCMCRIDVLSEGGALTAIATFKGRYFLLGAAALCVGLCWLSSLYLWRVNVYGCRNISQRELTYQLAAMGLRPGARISSVDKEEIKLSIMTAREDVAYITINIRGSEARVDIKEREDDGLPPLPDAPCDIVCDRDGIIKSIQVLEGQQVAQAGQTVIAGDVLVGGAMVSSQGETRLTRAMANVTLRTWRQVKMAMSREVYALDPTGRTRTRYSLEVGRERIEGYVIEKSPFAWYYKTREVVPLGKGSLILPFARLIKETYYECTPRELELSEGKCALLLEESARAALEGAIGDGEIISSSVATDFGGDRLCLTLSAECEERAGEYRPIEAADAIGE